MRHYLEGAAQRATEVTDTPIINAGDGAHQHPSQTMLDLYSIYKTQGRLDDIVVTMVGDLKYGRTVHSLLQALSQFRVRFNFVACPQLRMPTEFTDFCRNRGIPYTETQEFSAEVINSSDILYMTRVQRERFADLREYEQVKDLYTLSASMLTGAKPTMRVLHPLPRVNEIAQDVDDTPQAYYFEQARNGLYARQAMICRCLGIDPDGNPLQASPIAPLSSEPLPQGDAPCANPKCVSASEQMPQRVVRGAQGELHCAYCSHKMP